MRQLPAVRIQSNPIFCDQNDAVRLAQYSVDALLVSQPHWRLKSGAWSGGGEFFQVSEKVTHNGRKHFHWIRNNVPWIGTAAGVSPYCASADPNFRTMVSGYGTISAHREANRTRFANGWARTRPGNPEASVAQFVYELRDFPQIPGAALHGFTWGSAGRVWLGGFFGTTPHRILESVDRVRAVGHEYLNHVFGWEPLVKDLQKIYYLMKTIDKRLAQIKRDNGRGIRRGATVEKSTDTTQTSNNYTVPFVGACHAPPNSYPSSGTTSVTVTTTTKVNSWFRARYSYYVPDINSWQWDKRARAVLFGALPTPHAVWSVLPWSWMVDWFMNVSDVVSNMSNNAVDNLVAQYAYIMTQTESRTVATSFSQWQGRHTTGVFVNDVDAGALALSTVAEKITKVRVAGSPYGLGVKFTDLSARQLGVLAALGITQSRF